MNFLTARWSNLFLVTYAVPPALLKPRLAPTLELDVREDAPGKAFVSLVAFDFLDTRVLGVPWPGYRDFAELNLRFYVRRKLRDGAWERGVMFIREFVPQRLVAFMARAIYNEPYVAANISSRVDMSDRVVDLEHRLYYQGRNNIIRAVGIGPATCPPADSTEHFFKEHQWGYGRSRKGRLIRYQVSHPAWDCYRVKSWSLDFNFGQVYGPEWAFLADEKPISTVLAAGSEITVSPKNVLDGHDRNPNVQVLKKPKVTA